MTFCCDLSSDMNLNDHHSFDTDLQLWRGRTSKQMSFCFVNFLVSSSLAEKKACAVIWWNYVLKFMHNSDTWSLFINKLTHWLLLHIIQYFIGYFDGWDITINLFDSFYKDLDKTPLALVTFIFYDLDERCDLFFFLVCFIVCGTVGIYCLCMIQQPPNQCVVITWRCYHQNTFQPFYSN